MSSKTEIESGPRRELAPIPETLSVNHKKPAFLVRYYIAIVGSLSCAFMFAVRCNLSVAIVSMTYDDLLPVNVNTNDSDVTIETVGVEKFRWTASQEGIVLGSYYYGYAGFQILTGVLSDKLNVVHLNIVCHLGSAVLTALTPIAARAGVFWISTVRTLIGIFHASMLSSLLVLYSKWFPPNEVALPICLQSAGSNIGIAVIMPLTAWLCKFESLGGWTLAFYSIAAFNLIIPILWFFTITRTPATHPFISQFERNYIEKANSNIGNAKIKIHWWAILTSPPVWAVIAAKGMLAFGYMIINTKIPAYLETEIGLSLTSNGAINSIVYIAIASSQLSVAPTWRWFIDRGYFGRTFGRKLAESITTFIPAIGLAAIPFVGTNATLVILLLVFITFFMGFQSAGDMPIISEIAPDLAGSVFGVCNTIGSAAGFIAPMIIGELLDSGLDHSAAWRLVFFIGAGVMVCGGILFILLATSQPQPWGISPSRSTDSLASVLENSRPRPKKLQVHPVFSRTMSFN